MISPRFGENTNETAHAYGGAVDPYEDYELELRSQRQLLAGGGAPTYLLTHLPSNYTWWYGDGDGWADVRLNRACSSVAPVDIPSPDFEEGNVLELSGPYSAVGVTRPNEWALVDPDDNFIWGDSEGWSVEAAQPVAPYYEFDGTEGGW